MIRPLAAMTLARQLLGAEASELHVELAATLICNAVLADELRAELEARGDTSSGNVVRLVPKGDAA